MKKIKTVILCGGIGSRLKEETEFKPKPMIEIGGKPILWHIMKIYSHAGINDFILALGYKGNQIKDYFINQKYYDSDFTLNAKSNKSKIFNKESLNEKFRITFSDTGVESLTGERIRRLQKYINGETFMVTYGDGVADIDIRKLLTFHKEQKTIATITGVHPTQKYGLVQKDNNNLVKKFVKKPRISDWINGGFMVFNKKIFDYIQPDSMIEDAFFPLIEEKQLSLFLHSKFFHSMDTYSDMVDLNTMWEESSPWKIWS